MMILIMTLATASYVLIVISIHSSIIANSDSIIPIKPLPNEKRYRGVSFMLKASIVIAQAINPACFLLSMTMLSKVCKPKTRGTFFAFNGLFGSVMIVLIQLLGE